MGRSVVIQIHKPANGDGVGFAMRPRPSMPLLKRVLVGGGHSIGQRVLVAGSDSEGLMEWLNSLGFDVDSLDTASLDLAAGDSSGAMFDLILVEDFDRYRGSLLDMGSRLLTAQLLSRLKLGGDFVVIRDAALDPTAHTSSRTSHDAACWTRHLACFPGRFESTVFPASWFSRGTWHWMLGYGSAPAELMVSLRIPLDRLTPEEWQAHARRGLLTGEADCCSVAIPVRHQRHAA